MPINVGYFGKRREQMEATLKTLGITDYYFNEKGHIVYLPTNKYYTPPQGRELYPFERSLISGLGLVPFPDGTE